MEVFSRRVLAISRFSSPNASGPPTASVAVPLLIREIEKENLLPMPRDVEGLVDDPSLANPLQRQERLGTGWFGCILEWGAIFESRDEVHVQAWLKVADELGYARPLGQSMRRIKGLRDDVCVTRVFNWTQNSQVAKKVAARKAEVFEQLLEGRPPAEMLEARPFLTMLKKCNIPIALACSLPEKTVLELLEKHDLAKFFDVIVTAEDGGATEVEWYFMYSAQRIQRPPMRCIVVGESNVTVEASRELGMKCVVLSGHQPVYHFASADLVVKDLTQLSFFNLKKLFGEESRVLPRLEESEEDLSSNRNNADQDEGSAFLPSDDFDDDGLESVGGSFRSSGGMAFGR